MERSGSFSSSRAHYQPLNDDSVQLHDSTTASTQQQPVESSISANKKPIVNFRTLSGQLLSVSCPSLATMTVAELKTLLESQHSIPYTFQRLIFSGRELLDDRQCSEYGIEDGAMIHLLLRQTQSTTSHVGTGAVSDNGSVPVGNDGMAQFSQYHLPIAPPVDDSQPVTTDDEVRLRMLVQLSRAIRVLSLIDAIWLIVISVKLSYFLMIGLILAIAGYVGAHFYRHDLTLMFVLYIALSISTRIYYMVNEPQSAGYFLMALAILIDLYLLRLVLMFWRGLKRITEVERQELLATNAINAFTTANY